MFVRIEVVDCFIQKPSSIVRSVHRPLYAQIILDECIALLAITEAQLLGSPITGKPTCRRHYFSKVESVFTRL